MFMLSLVRLDIMGQNYHMELYNFRVKKMSFVKKCSGIHGL